MGPYHAMQEETVLKPSIMVDVYCNRDDLKQPR